MDISSRFDRFIAHIQPSRAQLEGANQQKSVPKFGKPASDVTSYVVDMLKKYLIKMRNIDAI